MHPWPKLVVPQHALLRKKTANMEWIVPCSKSITRQRPYTQVLGRQTVSIHNFSQVYRASVYEGIKDRNTTTQVNGETRNPVQLCTAHVKWGGAGRSVLAITSLLQANHLTHTQSSILNVSTHFPFLNMHNLPCIRYPEHFKRWLYNLETQAIYWHNPRKTCYNYTSLAKMTHIKKRTKSSK